MSAFKWLTFVLGIPLCALLISFVYSFTNPALSVMRRYSSSETSAQGITYYEQFLTWLPLMVLALLGFMLLVGVVNRRNNVTR